MILSFQSGASGAVRLSPPSGVGLAHCEMGFGSSCAALSGDVGAGDGGALPVLSVVQSVCDRCDRQVWAVAGQLAGGAADLPVSAGRGAWV